MHLDGLGQGNKPGADRPRRLKPGTLLLREYQGERHTVTVVANGYVWRETIYASLSTIARAITGTSWNGPRFFGLRSRAPRRSRLPPVTPIPPGAQPRSGNPQLLGNLAQRPASSPTASRLNSSVNCRRAIPIKRLPAPTGAYQR
jgi:hypothetical protein